MTTTNAEQLPRLLMLTLKQNVRAQRETALCAFGS